MRAKKRLGQNFLVDGSFASRIVSEFAPRSDETIIEIGPGRGALTSRLVAKVARLIAIEFDRDLAPELRESFASQPQFNLLEADALEIDFCSAIAPADSARVVANLPYNISTAILQRLIAHRRCIPEMLLMLQREVVERIAAPAGASERGYLSVLVQAYFETEKLFDVPPSAFRPAPKVWSSVLRLSVREREPIQIHEELLWQVVSAGFAQRRKTILNNLRAAPKALQTLLDNAGGPRPILEAAEIDPQRRAETIELHEWEAITRAVENALR